MARDRCPMWSINTAEGYVTSSIQTDWHNPTPDGVYNLIVLGVDLRACTDKILGATIAGRHAGELISEVTIAMSGGLGLRHLATVIHPYPTTAEAIRTVADAYNRTR